MAKTKLQTKTLLQDMIAIYDGARTYLTQLATDVAALETEIKLGGPEDYMEEMLSELQMFKELSNSYWIAHRRLMSTVHMPLGQYAGSPAPTGESSVNISAFNRKLVDDAEAVESLGMTKNAFAPDGGNSGNGVLIELNTGQDGVALDCGHKETYTLECEGVDPRGRAQFSFQGSERKYFLWDAAMGSGNDGGGYRYDWGGEEEDFSRSTAIGVTSKRTAFVSWGGSDHRNMIRNGDFEAILGTGNSKIEGATILSGEANIDIDSSTPIFGSQSLKFLSSGDAEIEFPIVGTRVGRPQGMAMLSRRTGTITGTLTLVYRSGTAASPTDHETISITIGALVAGTVNIHKLGHIVPNDVGVNPRLVLKTASVGGAGSVEIEGLTCCALTVIDSNRAIAVYDGDVPFMRGDKFTGSNTITVVGQIQRMFNELFGRGIKHAGVPVYWTDS